MPCRLSSFLIFVLSLSMDIPPLLAFFVSKSLTVVIENLEELNQFIGLSPFHLPKQYIHPCISKAKLFCSEILAENSKKLDQIKKTFRNTTVLFAFHADYGGSKNLTCCVHAVHVRTKGYTQKQTETCKAQNVRMSSKKRRINAIPIIRLYQKVLRWHSAHQKSLVLNHISDLKGLVYLGIY